VKYHARNALRVVMTRSALDYVPANTPFVKVKKVKKVKKIKKVTKVKKIKKIKKASPNLRKASKGSRR